MNKPVGIIIGRFQVNKLHPAHLELITRVLREHPKTMIVLGVAPSRNNDSYNPLTYPMRQQMIQAVFPTISTVPLKDHPDDKVWSGNLDSLIRDVYPTEEIVLYGSRDSFIPHYSGKFKTVELEPMMEISGTETREQVGREIVSSDDFRAGVIYATQNRTPAAVPCVDIVVFRASEQYKKENSHSEKYVFPPYDEMLLIYKDNLKTWCLPGGHVDATDITLEAAAAREVGEETSLNFYGREMTYVCSRQIPDWRYNNENKLIVSLYSACWKNGNNGIIKANDDADNAKWFKVSEFSNYVVGAHALYHDDIINALKKHNQELKAWCESEGHLYEEGIKNGK